MAKAIIAFFIIWLIGGNIFLKQFVAMLSNRRIRFKLLLFFFCQTFRWISKRRENGLFCFSSYS